MNVYSIDVRIVATAYIKAESEAEAKQIAAAQLAGSQLCLPDRVSQPEGCVEIFGLEYSHPDMPAVSLSPAMSVDGPADAEPELVEEL
jgi:hypothetical protein